MRSRMIKPEFFQDCDLAQVSPLARLLLCALWCLADDDGGVLMHPKKIKALCLPYDSCDIDKLLTELSLLGVLSQKPNGIHFDLDTLGRYFVVADMHFRHGQRVQRLADAQLKGTHTEEEWQALVDEFDSRCLCCLLQTKVTKDHIIPIRWGGSDAIDNLQPLCKSCNSRKHAKTLNWVEIRRREGMEPLAEVS